MTSVRPVTATRPRLVPALVAVLALGLGTTAGCSTSGSGTGERADEQADTPTRAVAACAVLDRDAPGGGTRPGEPTLDVGNRLVLAFGALDPAKVHVYLDPGSDGQLPDLDRALAERSEVTSTRVADVDDSFALFQDLFAGEDDILESMRPVDLPTSVTARTDSAEAAESLADWAAELDGFDVFEVRTVEHRDAAVRSLGETMVAESHRSAWHDLAEDLDRIEGNPEWSALAAELIRATLEQGDDGDLPGTLASRREAHDDLADVQRECRADA